MEAFMKAADQEGLALPAKKQDGRPWHASVEDRKGYLGYTDFVAACLFQVHHTFDVTC